MARLWQWIPTAEPTAEGQPSAACAKRDQEKNPKKRRSGSVRRRTKTRKEGNVSGRRTSTRRMTKRRMMKRRRQKKQEELRRRIGVGKKENEKKQQGGRVLQLVTWVRREEEAGGDRSLAAIISTICFVTWITCRAKSLSKYDKEFSHIEEYKENLKNQWLCFHRALMETYNVGVSVASMCICHHILCKMAASTF